MCLFRRIVLCVCMVASYVSYAQDHHYLDLFILAGQSNARGCGNNYNNEVEDATIDYQIPFWNLDSDKEWKTLGPTNPTNQSSWGPEITFAHELKNNGYFPAIFKYAKSSSSLLDWGNVNENHWLGPGEGGHYDRMIESLINAISELEAMYDCEVNVKGFVWVQGVTDIAHANEYTGMNYKEKLLEIISDLRTRLNVPNLPVIINVNDGIPENPTYSDLVPDAQNEIADEDEFISFFSIGNLDKKENDVYHLSNNGLKEHGCMVFSDYVKLSRWKEEVLTDGIKYEVMENTRMKYSNDKMFYVTPSGIINVAYRSQKDNWVEFALSYSAPRMKNGSQVSLGFDVVPELNSKIFYVTHDKKVNSLTWNESSESWEDKVCISTSSVRNDSELKYKNGAIYCVHRTGHMALIYKISNQIWGIDWISETAPKVKEGTRFAVTNVSPIQVFYIGEDNKIYRLYKDNGWKWDCPNPLVHVKSGTGLKISGNSVFYVNPNDIMMVMYKNSSGWHHDWLTSGTPKVMQGSDFDVVYRSTTEVYYADLHGNLIKIYYKYGSGWIWMDLVKYGKYRSCLK